MADEQSGLRELFRERIYPVLTPLVVDPAHPFPYISGLSLSLAVMVADPDQSPPVTQCVGLWVIPRAGVVIPDASTSW